MSKMSQIVSKYLKIFQNVSRCLKMSQNVSNYLQMFQNNSNCLKCPKLYQNVSFIYLFWFHLKIWRTLMTQSNMKNCSIFSEIDLFAVEHFLLHFFDIRHFCQIAKLCHDGLVDAILWKVEKKLVSVFIQFQVEFIESGRISLERGANWRLSDCFRQIAQFCPFCGFCYRHSSFKNFLLVCRWKWSYAHQSTVNFAWKLCKILAWNCEKLQHRE